MARSDGSRRFVVTLVPDLESPEDVDKLDEDDLESIIENHLIDEVLFIDVTVEEVDE